MPRDTIDGKIELPDSEQIRHHIIVILVSQFLSAPRTTYLEAAMRILRYLNKTPGRGLLYSDQRHIRVQGFSDAD